MHHEFEMPNGTRGNYYFVHTTGSSMVVPLRDDGRVLLTCQYRYLVDRASIEFPAGGVKKGQSYEDAARDELREESGYEASELISVGEMIPMNGITDEVSKVYLARGLRPVGQALEYTEEGMEVFAVSPEEVEAMIARNDIQDGMTLAAWAMARAFLARST